MTRHIPVLLEETIEGLYLKKGDVVVDATLGGGGHTCEILKRVLPGGKVIAIDADKSAIVHFRTGARQDEFLGKALAEKSLILEHKNYSLLRGVLESEGIEAVDAIFADLGFSSDQIEDGERGFSFQKSGPLDMRLNQETELTAEMIVNTFSSEKIEKIIRDYGDESEARRIARAIVTAREKKPLTMTDELALLIENIYPKGKRFRLNIHPATKTFQAFRIAVNQEYEHLEKFLEEAVKYLRTGGLASQQHSIGGLASPKRSEGGRLAVITFHSGEDRIVQQFFKSQAKGCICPPGFPICSCGQKPVLKILTKKPIIPSNQEIKDNPRARSARLRIAERL